MDDSRFDQIAKDAASSRRKLLRGLAGAIGGGALVATGLGEADAGSTCRQHGQICREDANCCYGRCGAADRTGRRRCESCFVAGTRIAMADGTSRAIELVAAGDYVLGAEGRVNRVIDIERPVLGDRLLYALNDGNFFVTAEHPFMTEVGWKSVNPRATADENSALHVGRLDVGDRLMVLMAVGVPMAMPAGRSSRRLDEQFEIHLDSTTLVSLVGRPADPRTPLYNLLLDGDHAYFANELLVHNKG